MLHLTLYICSTSAWSAEAVRNLDHLREQFGEDDWEVHVVDILDNPDLAEEHHILATPTLVRTVPPPERRVVGDLSDMQTVITALGIRAPAP